jgi:hypothetical protein
MGRSTGFSACSEGKGLSVEIIIFLNVQQFAKVLVYLKRFGRRVPKQQSTFSCLLWFYVEQEERIYSALLVFIPFLSSVLFCVISLIHKCSKHIFLPVSYTIVFVNFLFIVQLIN